MRPDLPSGTVTFLFTDVEGSTRLLDELGAAAYAAALAEHRAIVREACTRHGGTEVDTQGDAFFVAFPTAPSALAAAVEAQRSLTDKRIRVRMGLHSGTPLLTEEGYVGADVHRAARIAAAGHGGQVLLSAATAVLTGDAGLRDLGEHRFKDLSSAERVYQIGDGDFPALKSLYRTNLPAPATPFVGRADELEAVISRLERPDARLVTLTGPGGTGKTRLALQAAAEVAESFPDGLWWVGLAALGDSALVLSTLAQTLDVQVQPGARLDDAVAGALAGKRLLVLLDNAEHLLPEIAGELAAFLSACPTARLLVTSRERLRVQAETVWPVPPLSAADGEALFVERALALDPDFKPTATVSELCRRLDELPLAIELAAARTNLFSVDQLLARLGDRLDIFKAGRDADPRQQTLRATIAWSHELLDESDSALFRRLSVFAGGCSYEAAEQVCDANPETLQSLLDKSLVRRRTDKDGQPRFWMLETIREYATERLREANEEKAILDRFVDLYVAYAEAAQPGWHDEEAQFWLYRFEDELGNIRAALGWALEHQPDMALKIVADFGWCWQGRGLFPEMQEWIHGAQERLAGAANVDPRVWARSQLCLATAAFEAGDETSIQLGRSCLALLSEADLIPEHALALVYLALRLVREDPAEAERLAEMAEKEAYAHGRLEGVMVDATNVRAQAAYIRGDTQSAASLYEQAIKSATPDTYTRMMALGHYSDFCIAQRQAEEAARAAEEAREIAAKHFFMRELPWWEIALAQAALLDRNPDQAEKHLNQARSATEERRAPHDVIIRIGLAEAALQALRGENQIAQATWQAVTSQTHPSEWSLGDLAIEEDLLKPLAADSSSEQRP